MSGASSIEWTDSTWNPVRGCSRVSEGCRNCYAERVAARFSGWSEHGDPDSGSMKSYGPFHEFAERTKAGPRWTGRVELIPSKLDEPLRWKKPRRIFVNSMSDLFHEELSDAEIAKVFGVMALASWHTFQILTKRPVRMSDCLSARPFGNEVQLEAIRFSDQFNQTRLRRRDEVGDGSNFEWPLPNVWLGTSVENQATADERIPHLLATPAAKRFVSYEPAIEAVDFRAWLAATDLREIDGGPALDWLIVGGESGPGARPFDIAWARSTVEQCKAAGVACFVKQLGQHPHETMECFRSVGVEGALADLGNLERLRQIPDGWTLVHQGGKRDLLIRYNRLRDRKGGDWNEWPEDLRVREFPR